MEVKKKLKKRMSLYALKKYSLPYVQRVEEVSSIGHSNNFIESLPDNQSDLQVASVRTLVQPKMKTDWNAHCHVHDFCGQIKFKMVDGISNGFLITVYF